MERVVALIAVVVPNWNGATRLRAAVESLAAQLDPGDDVEVIVVDNASTDDSLALLERLATELRELSGPGLTTLRNDTNLGFAGGVNRGIEHARARGAWAIALFNNDAVAAPGWLAALTAVLRERPDVSLVTGRFLMADGATVDSTGDFVSEWGIPYPRDRDRPAEPARPSGEVFGVSGGASLYRTALFDDIGTFDERYFAYLEDVDLSFRARLAGHRARYCAEAIAYHDQGSTSRTMPGFAARQYFRNLPLVLARNLPLRRWPSVMPRFALVYHLMILNAFRRGFGRAAVSGMLRGWALMPGALSSRRAIRPGRPIDAASLATLLTPGLPPGVRVLRGTRDRLTGAWRRVAARRRRLPERGGA